MASWIHNPLCLILAPIHSGAASAPANKYSDTMTKGEHDDEKLVNYTSAFWWDIFKTFFFFFSQQSNSLSSVSLLPFSTWFWVLQYVLDKHFTTDQLISCTLYIFTSLHLSFIQNDSRVSATTCCVEREGVCMWAFSVCNYESECVLGGGGGGVGCMLGGLV